MSGRRALALAVVSAFALAPGPTAAAGRMQATRSAGAASRVVKFTDDTHKLLLRADGTVAGWGLCQHGQLGPVAPIPRVRNRSTVLVAIALPAKAVDIAAGATASYALLDDGTVRAWGGGAIGDGRAPSEYGGPPRPAGPAFRPVEVPGLTGVVALSTSGGHVLALTKDGRVLSWGGNFYGALGRPPRTELALDRPAEVPGLTEVVQVAAGLGVSTALKKDATVWVWGSNWQQQYGFPASTDQPGPERGWVLEPKQVPGLTGAAEVALGHTGRQTLVRLRDGMLRVWGGGGAGEFPLTSNVRVPMPAPPGLQ